MMFRAIGLISCVSASLASAQSLSVHVSFDQTELAIGESTTATMSASFEAPTGHPESYFELAVMSVEAIGHGSGFAASDLVLGDWHMPLLGPLAGEVSGASIENIYIAQNHLFGPVDSTASDLVIATWTITSLGSGQLSYEAAMSEYDEPYPFAIIDMGGGPLGAVHRFDYDALTSDTLVAGNLPAPNSVAVFGLAALGICRRHRR